MLFGYLGRRFGRLGSGRGTAAAGVPPVTPAYTYRGEFTDSGASTVATYSVNIGTASADRLVIVAVAIQNAPVITSLVVNGVTLNQDVLIAVGADIGIFSGLVVAGSGAQNIVLTCVSAGFLERDIFVWTATGLSSNLVKNTMSYSANTNGTINITSGDFLFAVDQSSLGVFSSVDQTPTATHTIGALSGRSAEWLTTVTAAAFNVHVGANATVAAASYR